MPPEGKPEHPNPYDPERWSTFVRDRISEDEDTANRVLQHLRDGHDGHDSHDMHYPITHRSGLTTTTVDVLVYNPDQALRRSHVMKHLVTLNPGLCLALANIWSDHPDFPGYRSPTPDQQV